MAEVIGLVAAAVQFIDVGGRIVIKLSQLCSDLQNVPHRMSAAKQQLEQLLSLLQMIKADLTASDQGPASTLAGLRSPAHLFFASNLVEGAVRQAEALVEMLDNLEPKKGTLLNRKWRAFVSLQKEDDIVERCARLESLKSSLQVWYGHQSMVLLGEQIFRTRALESSMVASFATIRNQKPIFTVNENPGPNLELHNRGADRNTLTTDDLHEISNAVAERVFVRLTSNPADDNSSGIINATQGTHDIHPLARPTARPKPPKPCNCPAIGSTTQLLHPFFQVFYENQAHHQPSCPYRTTSYTLGVRFILLQLLKRSIDLSVRMELESQNVSFRQTVTIRNIVDRAKSPAFIAIDNARHLLWSLFDMDDPQWQEPGEITVGLGYNDKLEENVRRLLGTANSDFIVEVCQQKGAEAEEIIEDMCANLASCVQSGEASARDQDIHGATLLHDIVRLAMNLLCLQEKLRPTFTRTVKLLIDNGVDIDAPMTRSLGYDPVDWKGTALSWIIKILQYDRFSPQYLDCLRLDRILEQQGCVLSEPLKIGDISEGGAQDFVRSPSLALGWDYSRLSITVISRSEFDLRALLSSRYGGLDIEEPSPLCFALGWPLGMKLLLEAGANPSDTVHEAIRRDDTEALQLLLTYDCPMFAPTQSRCGSWTQRAGDSLIEYAMSINASKDIFEILLATLVKRRQRLRQLVIDHLHLLSPTIAQPAWLPNLESTFNLLDKGAYELAMGLEECNIAVPRLLWPGRRASVYHSENINAGYAQQLYDAGFHEIDIKDDKGFTPLAITIIRNRNYCGPASWYLDKGSEVKLACVPNCLHIMAHMRKSDLLYAILYNRDPAHIFGRLSDTCTADIPDSCFCYCSASGCTPASIVLRGSGGKYDHGRKLNWLINLPQNSSKYLKLTQACFADVCRLEIFERLEMTHICCSFSPGRTNPTPYTQAINSGWPRKEEDCREIQEEESELNSILDAYMQLYHNFLGEHDGTFETFWYAWWETMANSLPLRKSRLPSPDSKPERGSDGIPDWSRVHSSETNRGFGPREDFREIFRVIIGKYNAENVESRNEQVSSRVAPSGDSESDGESVYYTD